MLELCFLLYMFLSSQVLFNLHSNLHDHSFSCLTINLSLSVHYKRFYIHFGRFLCADAQQKNMAMNWKQKLQVIVLEFWTFGRLLLNWIWTKSVFCSWWNCFFSCMCVYHKKRVRYVISNSVIQYPGFIHSKKKLFNCKMFVCRTKMKLTIRIVVTRIIPPKSDNFFHIILLD